MSILIPSILKNIVLDKTLPSFAEAKIITSHKTRLGGDIIHLLTISQIEVFVKVGIEERLEIMREYKNISFLQEVLSVPRIYGYINTDDQAVIALEKMPGLPFHSIISSLEQ